MEIEDAMIEEMNFARMQPRVYAEEIEKYMREEKISKDEKLAGFAIARQMKTFYPARKLEFDGALHSACISHAKKMESKNEIIEPKKRYAMNVVGGHQSVRHSVITLLIDQGVKDKDHRKNILNPKFTRTACKYIQTKINEVEHVYVQAFK